MIVEFERDGNTYRCVIGAPAGPPPARLAVTFRPCVRKPAMVLELAYLEHDEVRGIELYTAAIPQQYNGGHEA
jgi:hypothetical protein